MSTPEDQNPIAPPEAGGEPRQPTEDEIRAQLEAEMARVRVEEVLIQTIASLVNLTARRIAKPDEQDLDQARLGIEAIKAWVDLIPEEIAKQIRDALAELQVLYVRESQGGGGGEAAPAGQEGPAGGSPPPARPAPEPSPPAGAPPRAEPPPRLWTPGR